MPLEVEPHAVPQLKGLINGKTYFVGKNVAVCLCNKKLIRKVPILLHTGQNECSVLTTAVRWPN